MHYSVLHKETDADKYASLRLLIEQRDCPAIVYVSRTKRTRELAQKLTDDGFPALPFNGKMDPEEKIGNQEAFIRNDVRVIVATSAFGMGVDKKDVVLDFFLDEKSVVVGLRSGDALKVDGTKIRKNRELVRPLLVPVLDKIGTPASSRVENAVRSGSIAVSDFQGAFRKIVTPYISIRADRHSSGPEVNDVPY